MAEIVRYAVMKNGVCINVVMWDGETKWDKPEGCEVIPGTVILPPNHDGGNDIINEADFGSTFDGEKFVK